MGRFHDLQRPLLPRDRRDADNGSIPDHLLRKAEGIREQLEEKSDHPGLPSVPSDVEALRREVLQRPRRIIRYAFSGLSLFVAIMTIFFMVKSDDFSAGKATIPFVDGLYWAVVTLTSVGYGDVVPVTTAAKLWSVFFILNGAGFLGILLSFAGDYLIEKQEEAFMEIMGGPETVGRMNSINSTDKEAAWRIGLSFGLAAGLSFLGAVVLYLVEGLSLVDTIYATCVSVATVGYGDLGFKTLPGRLFAACWLVGSTIAVGHSFWVLATVGLERRQRQLVERLLKRKFTFKDLVAADLDKDGDVGEAEFVLYKLRELGKVQDEDLAAIKEQFAELCPDSKGHITLEAVNRQPLGKSGALRS